MAPKYAAADWLPFCALMSAVLMLLTRLSDWDENMPAKATQSSRAVVIADRDQHLLGEGTQQITKHLLILPDPKWVERVGLESLLAVLVLGGEKLGRLRRGAVNIVEDTGATQLRCDLCAP